MAEIFDAPNLSTSCARRLSTIVAPQALTLLNGALTRTEAQHLAARIEKSTDPINEAFMLTLSRPPTETERQTAASLVSKGKEGLTSLAAVLFNLNEFLYVE